MVRIEKIQDKRIIIADSLSEVVKAEKGDVIVCGSHGGKSVAEYIINKNLLEIGGLIVNDAGIGKDEAGIYALKYLEKYNIPVVAVSNNSAKIGDGEDVFKNGIVSKVNSIAMERGVRVGMKAMEAAYILLNVKQGITINRFIYRFDDLDKIIIVRLRPGSDVITSLESLCKENGIEKAMILNMIGSLRKASILLPSVKDGNVSYTEPIEFQGPLEFLSGQGFVMKDADGLFIHVHGSFSDSSGRVYGGHLNKYGNIVLATLDITIAIPKNAKLMRMIDPDVNIGTMWIIE
jgi:predicted DNA-binding protein with PD1-like motif